MDVVHGYQILSHASIVVDTVTYLQKYEFCAVEITFPSDPKLINAHGEALAYKSHSCKSPADIVVQSFCQLFGAGDFQRPRHTLRFSATI